jgi:hypothetical protein
MVNYQLLKNFRGLAEFGPLSIGARKAKGCQALPPDQIGSCSLIDDNQCRGDRVRENEPPRAFAIATSTGRLNSSLARPGREGLERGGRTAGPARRGIHHAGRAAATRNPRLLFRFSGMFLLRFAGRQFLALLFQLPPRITRFEALAIHRE